MYLKYRKHRKIANVSLACIFLYSILVFLVLTRFCTIQFEIGRPQKVCLIAFAIGSFVFMIANSVDNISRLSKSSLIYNFSIRNLSVFVFLFCFAMFVAFIFLYNDSILSLFLLFLFITFCFFIICFANKRSISRDNVLLIYLVFFFIFLWPVVEFSIDEIPIVAKI